MTQTSDPNRPIEIPTGDYFSLRGTLEEFVDEPGCEQGVMVDQLEPGTKLVVGTKHSCYRLVITDAAARRAIVTGGKVFPESTEVRIQGSTGGGSVIKSGWIGVGLCLEMSTSSKRITTSPVKILAVDRVPSDAPVA